MKEKLNLTNLTKMTQKDLQTTKGGLVCRCHCVCYEYPDGTSEVEAPKSWAFENRQYHG